VRIIEFLHDGEPRQPLSGGVQRRVVLRKAESHDPLPRVSGREDRDGNRGHTDLAGQRARELDVRLVADGRVVGELEIGAARRHRSQRRAGQQPENRFALVLVEGASSRACCGTPARTARAPPASGGDGELHELVHLANSAVSAGGATQ